jgi:hypothetical protein
MKKINQILFGIAVVAIAMSTSAFKGTGHKLTEGQFRFYNISGVIDDTNPSNFVYQDNGSGECTEDLEKECSAVWTVELPGTDVAPEPGDNPNDFSSFSYDGDTDLGDSHQ